MNGEAGPFGLVPRDTLTIALTYPKPARAHGRGERQLGAPRPFSRGPPGRPARGSAALRPFQSPWTESHVRRPKTWDSSRLVQGEEVEEPKKSRPGVSCLLVGSVIAVIIFLIALFLPPITLPISKARQLSCENNLKQLRTLLSVYAEQYGGPEKRFPSETGKAFWLKLTETRPPLVAGEELEIFVCPGGDELPRPGLISYLGTGKDMNSLSGQDVIGCCHSGRHPDGFIFLRKDGSIVKLKPDTPEALRLKSQLKE